MNSLPGALCVPQSTPLPFSLRVFSLQTSHTVLSVSEYYSFSICCFCSTLCSEVHPGCRRWQQTFVSITVYNFSTRRDFAPPGGSAGDIFGCHNVRVATTGVWRVEATDAAKHPMMHRRHLPPSSQQKLFQPQMLIVPGWRPCSVVSHGTNIPKTPFTLLLAKFGLFLVFIVTKKQLWACLFWCTCVHISVSYVPVKAIPSHRASVGSKRRIPNCFPKWLYQFTLLLAVWDQWLCVIISA